mgnify:CR=1 FL=1
MKHNQSVGINDYGIIKYIDLKILIHKLDTNDDIIKEWREAVVYITEINL